MVFVGWEREGAINYGYCKFAAEKIELWIYIDREFLFLKMGMGYRVKFTILKTKSVSERKRIGGTDGRGDGAMK